jgi:hypothetical protein
MNQQFVGNVPALLPKQMTRTFQVDCLPEDDCSHYQIESAGSRSCHPLYVLLRIYAPVITRLKALASRAGNEFSESENE